MLSVLSARGQAEVSCEVDETNTASNALVTGVGARRVGGAVELMRPATGVISEQPSNRSETSAQWHDRAVVRRDQHGS